MLSLSLMKPDRDLNVRQYGAHCCVFGVLRVSVLVCVGHARCDALFVIFLCGADCVCGAHIALASATLITANGIRRPGAHAHDSAQAQPLLSSTTP